MLFHHNKMKSEYSYALLVLFILLLASCETSRHPNATPQQNFYPTIATTNVKAATSMSTEIAARNEETKKTTPSPTFSSSNNSLTEPTRTPRTPPPTLLPEEAEAADIKMQELYKTNGNCQLPCWWGFMPGKTKWTEAESFLSTLTNHVSISEIVSESPLVFFGEAYLFSGGTNYYQRQIYTIQDNKIVKINTQVGRIAYPNYTLANILGSYGIPNEIQISSYGHDNFGEVPFTVVLFFKENVMLLKYDTNASLIEIDGKLIVRGCIQDKSVSALGLWSPDKVLTFTEAVNETSGMNPSEGYLYRPLEEVSDMTIEAFYQTYLDPNTEICIETPAEIWADDH